MPKIVVPPPYRGPTRGVSQVEVSGATVRACVEAVEQEFPGFADQVRGADGVLHGFVNVIVNGEKLAGPAVLETELKPDDVVEIVAAIAGGAAQSWQLESHGYEERRRAR